LVLDGDGAVHGMRQGARWTLGEVPGADGTAPIGAALDVVRARGGGPVTLWIAGADRPVAAPVIEAADAAGLECRRRLLRLEVALPLVSRPLPDGVTITGFDDATDVATWLEVNNRAFDDHPEQGGWDDATFASRRAEPWFRAEDLRIARLDGRVVGSCWTKRTDDPGRPPIGEIYVIGLDPNVQGIGLGPAVVAEGLDHLARQCGAEIGMLYVDAANAPAVALYKRLGFHQVHEDHAYEGTVR
jgi:mycothiol synthase